MRIRVIDRKPVPTGYAAVVCFLYEGESAPAGLDAALRRSLTAEMNKQGFRGKASELLHWNASDGQRFIVLGLGQPAADAAETIRSGAARAAREAETVRAERVALILPGRGATRAADVRAAAEGVMMGNYAFERHLTDDSRRRPRIQQVAIAVSAATPALKRAARSGVAGAEAVCLARDLVNEAPSRMTPTEMARVARREARRTGLSCKVLGESAIRDLGMHALLAVSRGAKQPPRVVHMTYKPKGRASERIVLVGKGVTFDSGGLNLKPTEYMATMKCDMGGAGAVLATMTLLRSMGCRAEVHALLGLVENLTGSDAYKPGDILDTYAGKTVEIGNTDAEGRLVMCDLLAYAAKKIRPARMLDVATLTGAVVVALGTRATGLLTRHDKLRDSLMTAGAAAGEKIWPLPMWDDYLPLLQNSPADLNNVGGRWGGAITAALFLGEFVPRALPWAHLDIAGPAFTEVDLPEAAIGGTGAGVLTLMRWLESA